MASPIILDPVKPGNSRREALISMLAFAVAGCGGGGSPAPTQTTLSTPTPSPSPSPSPSPTPTAVTVGGGGQFATFAAAIASMPRSIRLLCRHSELVSLPPGIDIDFAGNVLEYVGDPTTPLDRYRVDPMLLTGSNRLANGTISARNSNYCIHSESAGLVTDFYQLIENMTLFHGGNNELADANPQLNTAERQAILSATPAVGIGMSSGGTIEFRDCAAHGSAGGIYVHNAVGQARPCRIIIRNTHLIGTPGLLVHAIGSGTRDVVELDRANIDNIVYIGPPEFEIIGTVTRPFTLTAAPENAARVNVRVI